MTERSIYAIWNEQGHEVHVRRLPFLFRGETVFGRVSVSRHERGILLVASLIDMVRINEALEGYMSSD